MFNLLAQVDIRNEYYSNHPDAGVITNSTGTFISRLLPNIIVLCGVVAVFYTARNGFNLVTAASKNLSPADISKARQALLYSFGGLLLVAAAFFILQIVSTVTGVNFINMGGIL